MNNEIIININEANKAQKYQNENEFFQIDAFKRVSEILKEHKVGRDTNDITDCRFHDTIFIDGDRGVGKTAFMVNIENYYTKYFKMEEKPKYIFLKSVDPTLLEHTEKFLGVILGKIVEMVSKRLKNNCIDEDDYYIDNNCDRKYKNEKPSKNCIDGYYKALENLSKSLSSVSSLENKQDVGIEEIASYKSSQKLEQYAHEFFKIVSIMFGVNAIVMLIDDVDMAFDKGFDVLEVVRKYLTSPYLIPIVAGDMKLYREIVETKFMDKIDYHKDISTYNTIKNIFDNGCSGGKEFNKYWDNSILGCDHQLLIQNRIELKEKKKLINNLVEQYLHKIFPNEYYIKLKDIFSILRENRVQVELKSNLIVPYTEIKDFEIRHINLGINQVQFTYQIFSNNTRDLVQYLFAKKDIYIEFFTKVKDKYPKEAVYKKYIPQDVIEKYDNEILHMIFHRSNLYKRSLDITSKNYEYRQGKEKELSNLTYNDTKSFRNDIYSIYNAFLGKVFENSKLSEEKSYDEIAINQTKFINHSYYIESGDSYNNEIEKYIFDIFTYRNYYESRAHTKNLIFSGRFLELMFYSFNVNEKLCFNDLPDSLKNKFYFDELSEKSKDKQINICRNKIYKLMTLASENERNEILKSINDHEIKDRLSDYFSEYIIGLAEINNKMPFNSIFMNNKNFLDTNNYSEEDEEKVFIIEYSEEFLSDLSSKILIWRNIYLDDIKISSISIYEITHKFFNNLNLLKAKFKELKNETPHSFMKRIIYIFINSIAFFENTNKKVANTNIAMADEFDDNNIKKSLAYNYNIEPLLKTKSLTNALFYHPIIEYILQKEMKLNLKFSNIINISNELKELGFKSGIGYETRMNIMNEIISKLLNNEYSNSYKKAFLDDKTFNEEFIYFKSNSKGFKDNMNSYKEVVDKLKKHLYA